MSCVWLSMSESTCVIVRKTGDRKVTAVVIEPRHRHVGIWAPRLWAARHRGSEQPTHGIQLHGGWKYHLSVPVVLTCCQELLGRSWPLDTSHWPFHSSLSAECKSSGVGLGKIIAFVWKGDCPGPHMFLFEEDIEPPSNPLHGQYFTRWRRDSRASQWDNTLRLMF